MSDKNKNFPKPNEKNPNVEKGQQSDINENKLPDFKFTPPTPPQTVPTKTDEPKPEK